MRKILVIIGPSGSGKSSVIRQLTDRGIISVTPSWTTRPPREDDKNAPEHMFISESEFNRKAEKGFFLETVKLFDLPYSYGLPAVTVSGDTVPTIVLRAPLIPLLKRHYQSVVIYQIQDSLDRVSERLRARQKTGEIQGSRLEEYEHEIALGQSIADRVFTNNGTPKSLADALAVSLRIDFNESRTE